MSNLICFGNQINFSALLFSIFIKNFLKGKNTSKQIKKTHTCYIEKKCSISLSKKQPLLVSLVHLHTHPREYTNKGNTEIKLTFCSVTLTAT